MADAQDAGLTTPPATTALREALQRLRNEASGFLALADVTAHGQSNLRSMQQAIDYADAALRTQEQS